MKQLFKHSGHSLNSLLYRASLLALFVSCFTFYASHSFAQGATGANRVKNVVEKFVPAPTTPSCPDDSLLTTTYCDHGCDFNPPSCTAGGGPSAGGVFMCVSTDLSQLGTLPGNCDGTGSCDAKNCKFVHIRNETTCGDFIDKITITVTKDASSSAFVVCKPVTNFGSNNATGCNWSTLWSIADLSSAPPTALTSEGCNTWSGGSGATTRNIEFTPPGGTTPPFQVLPCYHWTVVICGVNITNIKLHWSHPSNGPQGDTNFPNPTVNASRCPDTSSNQGWCP